MQKKRFKRDFDYYIDEYMYNCRSGKLRPKTMIGYKQSRRLFERWCLEETNIIIAIKAGSCRGSIPISSGFGPAHGSGITAIHILVSTGSHKCSAGQCHRNHTEMFQPLKIIAEDVIVEWNRRCNLKTQEGDAHASRNKDGGRFPRGDSSHCAAQSP